MAVRFEGTPQKLRFFTLPVTAAPLTVSVWVYPRSDPATLDIPYFSIQDSTQNEAFYLRSNNTSGIQWRTITGGLTTATADTGVAPTQNAWNHIFAYCASSSSRGVYLNGGNLDTDTNTAAPSGVSEIHVGDGFQGDSGGDRDMAELAVWNASLSATEMTSLYMGVSPLAIRPGNLVWYLPLWTTNYIEYMGGEAATVTSTPTKQVHPRMRYIAQPLYSIGGGITTHDLTANDISASTPTISTPTLSELLLGLPAASLTSYDTTNKVYMHYSKVV